jgi:hypothetical protein
MFLFYETEKTTKSKIKIVSSKNEPSLFTIGFSLAKTDFKHFCCSKRLLNSSELIDMNNDDDDDDDVIIIIVRVVLKIPVSMNKSLK